MTSYLTRRGGIWWVRLVVPGRLRTAVGRREFVRSCRTHELRIAKLVASVLIADWRRTLLALESVAMSFDVLKVVDGAPIIATSGYLPVGDAAAYSGLSVAEIIRAAAASSVVLHCRLSWARGVVMPIGELGLEPVIKTPTGKFVVQERPPRTPARDEMPDCVYEDSRNGIREVFLSRELAEEILANGLSTVHVQLFHHDYGHVFVCDSPVTVPVERLEVSADEINALRRRAAAMVPPERVAHARVERSAELETRALRDRSALEQSSLPFNGVKGKWVSKRFSEAVDAYCKSADGLPGSLRSHIDQRQRKAGLLVFAEFMGDRMLSEIDGDLLRAFRDGPLKTIPGRVNTLPLSIKRDTMRATIAALQEDGREWPLLSDEMRNERMQWLARFFAWVHSKGYLNVDPAATLRGETGLSKAERVNRKREADEDDEEGREPFNTAQLDLIFSQAHYRTGHGRHVKKPSFWYGFEYWLPLMGLYAGLRLKEASQLHLSDIRLIDDVWCFDINESTEDKSLKNDQSKRIVPVHPELIRLGFINYCERLRGPGYRRVFPELSWSRSNAKYAKETGRKMSAMLEALGMPRNGMLVFHCLRHNANNALARVPAAVISGGDENLKKLIRYALLGHAPGDDVNVRHYTTITAREKLSLLSATTHGLPDITPLDIDFAVEQIALALKKKNPERRGREDMGPLNDRIDPEHP